MEEKKTILIKKTSSFCPECKKVIPADILDDKGRVMMKKNCPEHGEFQDVVWSDSAMYLKAQKWTFKGKGVTNPYYKGVNSKECPLRCGLCNAHLSHTCLANIDLTNRCNLKCPICFANANASGFVYELSFEQVKEMLQNLRNQKPVPCTAIQFSGGEPTLHKDLEKIIKTAKEMGFSQIQIATNGLIMSKDLRFVQKLVDAGLSTVYLQFDGFKEETYKTTRGKKGLLDVKLQAIKNCRHASPKPLAVVLVVTLVKGTNDDEVGDIIKFAARNYDVVRGVIFQPVSFTSRIDKRERESQRYTLSDMARDAEKQTGFVKADDFYPVPIVSRISEMVSAYKGKEQISFTALPDCGLATFLFVNKEGKVVPINRFIEIDGFFRELENLTLKVRKYRFFIRLLKGSENRKRLQKTIDKYFGRYINKKQLPEGLDLVDFISSLIEDGKKETLGKFAWGSLMIGGMHFQDLYNYDIERVMSCVIHYATPDGRIIPFCAYNSGPTYREEIEKKFGIPLEDYKEK